MQRNAGKVWSGIHIIHHIGIIDKPIDDILICDVDSIAKKREVEEFVVSHKNFVMFKNVMVLYKDNSKPDYDYGNFEITISESGKTNGINMGRKRMVQLLGNLVDSLSKEATDKSLLDHLIVTRKRITF